MDRPVAPSVEPAASEPDVARGIVRGSALLFTGRILSKFTNFLVQVLIVRYLSQESFGGFAYALSVANLTQVLAGLGIDKAVTRFLPIYHEQGDARRFLGTIALAFLLVLSLGGVMVAVFHAFGATIARGVGDPAIYTLLSILIFLGPLQALDDLLTGMFAVFAKARAIFVRRHVIAPALKVVVVAALILSRSDVVLLAIGYLLSAVVGLLVYGVQLVRILRREGLLDARTVRELAMPAREVLGFAIPLLTTDLVHLSITAINVLLLGHFAGAAAVASFRAVQPAAQFCELVMISFSTLYTPAAARLFARQDIRGLDQLYWKTATWIAILTFPILAITFSLSKPLTVLLFGSRYESSAPILALLSAGYYFNAALGFNGVTLRVFGRVRTIVLLNLFTAAIGMLCAFVLIPPLGALGAGIAATIALVVHNVVKQAALRAGTGISLFEWRYVRVYVVVAIGAFGLLAFQALTSASAHLSFAIAVLTALLVLRTNGRALEMERMFPDVMRIPGASLLLTGRWRPRPKAVSE